jgi:hypothetical protein
MRFVHFASTVAACVAALALSPLLVNANGMNLRHAYETAIDHASGGMTASMTRVYIGTDTGTMEERTHDGILLNVRNTYTTSGGTFTFGNDTNRLSGFTTMQAAVTNDVFYFCSEDDNAVYRYNTFDDSMTRMAGNGVAGMATGTGTAARIDCGNSLTGFARNDQRDRVYAFSGQTGTSFWGLLVLTAQQSTGADAGHLILLAGTGNNEHIDGQGTAAGFFNVHQAVYYFDPVGNKEYLVLASSDNSGVIRYVDIADSVRVVTTAIQYSAANEHVSGTDNKAKMDFPLGLVGMPQRPVAFGCTASRGFVITWAPNMASFTMRLIDPAMSGKWGAAISPDAKHVFFGNGIAGIGSISRFDASTATVSLPAPPHVSHTVELPPPTTTAAATTTAAVTTTKAAPVTVPSPNGGTNAPTGPGGVPLDPAAPLTTFPVDGAGVDGSSGSAFAPSQLAAAVSAVILVAVTLV